MITLGPSVKDNNEHLQLKTEDLKLFSSKLLMGDYNKPANQSDINDGKKTNFIITEKVCSNSFCCYFELDVTMTFIQKNKRSALTNINGDDMHLYRYRF